MKTHEAFIAALRKGAWTSGDLAADLLELHDATGLSLDNWESAKQFIRAQVAQVGNYLTPEQVMEIGSIPYPNGA